MESMSIMTDEHGTWRKSSRTHTNHCVELRGAGDAVRDTKSRWAGALSVPTAGLVAFAKAWTA